MSTVVRRVDEQSARAPAKAVDAEPTETGTEGAGARPQRRLSPRRRRRGRPTARLSRPAVGWIAALAASAALAAGGGWAYLNAGHSPAAAAAAARDQALAAGRAEIAALATVHPDRVGRDLDAWQAATTGPLLDALRGARAANARKLTRSGVTAVATVDDAAVTQLDADAGNAQLIAAVTVRLTPRAGSGGSPGTERQRFAASLARTDGGWKLDSITAIPAGGAE